MLRAVGLSLSMHGGRPVLAGPWCDGMACEARAENNKADACASALLSIGAQEKTRTSTVLPPLGPEPSASTNSATWASSIAAFAVMRREVGIVAVRENMSTPSLQKVAGPMSRPGRAVAGIAGRCVTAGQRAQKINLEVKANAENNKADACASALLNVGAQEKTRTSTVLPPLGPEPSASTNSATWALNIAAFAAARPERCAL